MGPVGCFFLFTSTIAVIAPAASTTTATPIPMYKAVLESDDLLLANAVAVALGVADSLVGLGVADSVVGVGVGDSLSEGSLFPVMYCAAEASKVVVPLT